MNTLVLFLRLIRWKNLALLAYLMVIVNYVLLKTYQISPAIQSLQFLILIMSIILIAGAGYIINDIKDVKTDEINKPNKQIINKHIPIETAKTWYFFTNTIGVVLGIALSINLEQPSYSLLFLGTSLILYVYSEKLKPRPLIGNISVSLLIVLVIYILGRMILGSQMNLSEIKEPAWVLIMLMIFAFFLNLTREIIKDIEDVNGDKKLNMRTLPILIGRKRSLQFGTFLCIVPLGLILYLLINFSMTYKITMLFLFLLCFIPLLIIALKLFTLESFRKLNIYSKILKILMFLGISSLVFIQFN